MLMLMLMASLSAPPYSPYIEDRVTALENQLKSMQAPPVVAFPRPMAGPGVTVYAGPFAGASSTKTVSRTRSTAGIPVSRPRLFGFWR
jgi:hypothetical protein